MGPRLAFRYSQPGAENIVFGGVPIELGLISTADPQLGGLTDNGGQWLRRGAREPGSPMAVVVRDIARDTGGAQVETKRRQKPQPFEIVGCLNIGSMSEGSQHPLFFG